MPKPNVRRTDKNARDPTRPGLPKRAPRVDPAIAVTRNRNDTATAAGLTSETRRHFRRALDRTIGTPTSRVVWTARSATGRGRPTNKRVRPGTRARAAGV